MPDGVAIIRGKSHPARFRLQEQYESRGEFMSRVINEFSENVERRNTLTVEFVWNSDD